MAVPTARKPRHNPHTIEDSEPVNSKPSSRGAPKWADDPEEVNRELAAMDERDAQRAERVKAIAHTRAHQENIRRNKSAATRSQRAAGAKARADADAAARAAAAARPAAVLGRAQKRAQTIGSVLPQSSGLSVSDASGFTLALLVGGWVVLPLLSGGPAQLRNVWRAKFFNKGPDGSDLL